MNTQTQVHRLEAGQALALPRRGAGPAVLSGGELLVQAPARWLAGTVVLSAPVRLVAPAVLPAEPGCSVVAVRPSVVVVREVAPWWSPSRLFAAFQATDGVTADPAGPASSAAAARSIA